MPYTLKVIYSLLAQGFTGEDLRCLCYDTPGLRPVYDQFDPKTRDKARVIQLIIEHTKRNSQFETLLTMAKVHNPSKYESHQPYPEDIEGLAGESPSVSAADKGERMAKAFILFADNDLNFLSTRKEFLEQADYQVITATDPLEARNILEQRRLDLAILDIRLKDDEDDKDESGLILAKEVAKSVPKIILTGFPSYDYVRQALRPALAGLPVAVDFVAKKDGPNALLEAVQTALDNRNVFVVHGHDEAAKESVSRFIERLGLKAIILHEQPNAGRTIIEKFEDYANVGYVVVLLTPDDVGGIREDPKKLQPRARQNVIFELGYFMGKLGRAKVCALYKDQVELPSDYQGVLYIHLDSSGGWRLSLAKELRSAGIELDLNEAL